MKKIKYFGILLPSIAMALLMGCSEDEASVTVPTVTTFEITNITNSSLSAGGNVSKSGGADVTSRGICWSEFANPTIESDTTVNGGGIGEFDVQLQGLQANKTYHIKAYAINKKGVSYGNEKVITTVE